MPDYTINYKDTDTQQTFKAIAEKIIIGGENTSSISIKGKEYELPIATLEDDDTQKPVTSKAITDYVTTEIEKVVSKNDLVIDGINNYTEIDTASTYTALNSFVTKTCFAALDTSLTAKINDAVIGKFSSLNEILDSNAGIISTTNNTKIKINVAEPLSVNNNKISLDIDANSPLFLNNNKLSVDTTKIIKISDIKTTADDKTVYSASYINTLEDGLMPIGTILPFCSNIIPAGYEVCDGRIINVTNSSGKRFVSTKFLTLMSGLWGNGSLNVSSTNVKLPDLRHRFLGGVDIEANLTLGAYVDSALPNITGSFHALDLVKEYSGAFSNEGTKAVYSYGGPGTYVYTKQGFDASKCSTVYINDFNEVRPPTAVVNYIIRVI